MYDEYEDLIQLLQDAADDERIPRHLQRMCENLAADLEGFIEDRQEQDY